MRIENIPKKNTNVTSTPCTKEHTTYNNSNSIVLFVINIWVFVLHAGVGFLNFKQLFKDVPIYEKKSIKMKIIIYKYACLLLNKGNFYAHFYMSIFFLIYTKKEQN